MYFLWSECASFPAGAQATANESVPSTTGSGTLTPVTIPGLSAGVNYCYSACVVDLTVDPYTAVCGGVQNFTWTSPVSLSLKKAGDCCWWWWR